MLKQFISKQSIPHNEVIKIKLSKEQLNVLVEVLFSTLKQLGKENKELRTENEKLKHRLNLVHRKSSSIPF